MCPHSWLLRNTPTLRLKSYRLNSSAVWGFYSAAVEHWVAGSEWFPATYFLMSLISSWLTVCRAPFWTLSRRKDRGEEGGDVSHFMVVLSSRTSSLEAGDWWKRKEHFRGNAETWRQYQHYTKQWKEESYFSVKGSLLPLPFCSCLFFARFLSEFLVTFIDKLLNSFLATEMRK